MRDFRKGDQVRIGSKGKTDYTVFENQLTRVVFLQSNNTGKITEVDMERVVLVQEQTTNDEIPVRLSCTKCRVEWSSVAESIGHECESQSTTSVQFQVCVKARTGRTWYAADSAVFPESMMLHEIDSEIDRLNLAYPELYFEALPYQGSRKIAPKKYRPWV